jgi:N-acetylglutamate synthase-like GNAT family acetyltransferase
MMFQIHAAEAQDLAAIEALLVSASLPLDGLTDQFPSCYVIARANDVVIGAAGLELYGANALLRSVVVLRDFRHQGVASALVENRMTEARKLGVTSVFLLTTTAADYFKRHGFEPTPREDAPLPLAESPEFARACPASATCMARTP